MRLSPLTDPTSAQVALRNSIAAGRGAVRGPFEVLLRSPGLGIVAEALATYCSHDSGLPVRVRELTLMVTAARFEAANSWRAHLGAATGAGIDAQALERLARGDDPAFPDVDDDLVYRFASMLLDEHFIDDETFAAALARFGEAGLVDVIGTLGNAALLGMLLTAFEVR
jgi:4-carboxymuconolactone decarboxylase